MTNVSLFKQDGSQAGDITLNDAVFGIEPNESVVFDVILSQRASLRQGTHAVKTVQQYAVVVKTMASKGTGRARQGSIRSPQWRGGGVVFGPTPRSYGYKLPQKVRQLALKSVYSEKVAENKLVAVDALNFDAPKTAEFVKVLEALAIERKVLVIFENEGNKFAELSARNIPNVQVTTANSASVLDIANNDKILVTQAHYLK